MLFLFIFLICLLFLLFFRNLTNAAYRKGIADGRARERASRTEEAAGALRKTILECARSAFQQDLVCIIISVPADYLDEKMNSLIPIRFGSSGLGSYLIHKDALVRIARATLTPKRSRTSHDLN